MRILVDENIPRMTGKSLVEMGHDVKDIRGSSFEGIPDEGIWDLTQEENRMLIKQIRVSYNTAMNAMPASLLCVSSNQTGLKFIIAQ